MSQIDVCLLLEGTYPFVTGGVSSWVHTLITNLKHLKFGVVHISPYEGYFKHGYSYQLPENVVSVQEVYLHDYKMPKKASRESIEEQIALFRGFINDLHDGNTAAFQEFYRAVNTDLGGGLNAASIFQTKESWDVLVESYSEEAPEESFINYFWTWRYALFPLFNILSASLPDAHLYHTISTGYAGMLAAGATLRAGRPMMLTEHGIYAKERRIEIHRADWIQDWASGEIVAERKAPFFKRFWTRQFAMMSKVTYAHSTEIYTLYEGNRQTQITDGAVPDRCQVIPNGIDLVRYGEAAKAFDARAENERFTVGFVGRVSPIKDVKTLLRAARLVANEEPKVRFRIMGPMDEDPKYVDACKKLFNRLHLEGIAEFEGKVNVLEEFPKIDLLVLTSISEAQPLVILEAGAVGVPTVTTDVGSCSELLGGSTPEDRAIGSGGLLTPIASPGETAKAILKLIRDPDLLARMGKAMRERVHRFYALDDMIRAYGQIYDRFQPGGELYGKATVYAHDAASQVVSPVPSEGADPAGADVATGAGASSEEVPQEAAREEEIRTAKPSAEIVAEPSAAPNAGAAEAGATAPVAPGAPAPPAAETPATPGGEQRGGVAEPEPAARPARAPEEVEVLERGGGDLRTTAAGPVHDVVPLVVSPSTENPAAAPIPTALARKGERPLDAGRPPARLALPGRTPRALPAPHGAADERALVPVDDPTRSKSLSRLGSMLETIELLEGYVAVARALEEALRPLALPPPSTRLLPPPRSLARQRDEDARAVAGVLAPEEDRWYELGATEEAAEGAEDWIELEDSELPRDLPLECQVLDGGAIPAVDAKHHVVPPELELTGDLLRELLEDSERLRAALRRESEELAQLESELICIDEVERLASQLHGPAASGPDVWWGSAEHGAAVDEAEAVELPTTFERDSLALAGAPPEEEEWYELSDEDLPRDFDITCDVLGADAVDEECAEEPEPPARTASPAKLGADAEEEPWIELSDDDLPRDFDITCDVLAGEGPPLLRAKVGAPESSSAAEARDSSSVAEEDEQELPLQQIDDLLLELLADQAGLLEALAREREELAQLEHDLICLDEVERLAEEMHGPPQLGPAAWWGQPAEPAPAAPLAACAAGAPAPAVEESPESWSAGEARDLWSARPSLADDPEEWVELRDEDLPRDFDITCDVLGSVEEEGVTESDEEEDQPIGGLEIVESDALPADAEQATDRCDGEPWIVLQDEDLPRDFDMTCDVLAGEGPPRVDVRRPAPVHTPGPELDPAAAELELELERIDDLLAELLHGNADLLAALAREREELAHLENDLICLDEVERLAEEMHGPPKLGPSAWWGVEEVAAEKECETPNDELLDATDAEAREQILGWGSQPTYSDEPEEWVELRDEDLPRDFDIHCDVLGGVGPEDDEDEDDDGEFEAPSASTTATAIVELETANAPTEAAGTEAEEVAEEEHAPASAADEPWIVLQDEDLPRDFDITCDVLAGEGPPRVDARRPAPVHTPGPELDPTAAELELELERIDDLLAELLHGNADLLAALAREREELAHLESDLICLDEVERLAEEMHGPPKLGPSAWWGVEEVAAEEECDEADSAAEAETAEDESFAEGMHDPEEPETWLDLDDEDLPRDMPLTCAVLGEEESLLDDPPRAGDADAEERTLADQEPDEEDGRRA